MISVKEISSAFRGGGVFPVRRPLPKTDAGSTTREMQRFLAGLGKENIEPLSTDGDKSLSPVEKVINRFLGGIRIS